MSKGLTPSFVKCLVNCIPFADCFLTGIFSKLICKLNNCYLQKGQRKYFLLATLQGVKYQQNVEKQCVQFCKSGGQGFCSFFPIFFKKTGKNLCFSHLYFNVADFAAFLPANRLKLVK
jgi:hypothetical protein